MAKRTAGAAPAGAEVQNSDKMRALDAALSQIEKQYGKGAVMRLGEHSSDMNVETIPTGSLSLDIALDDGKGAEGHARQILRQDRDNKLANYVMGSLSLRSGEYTEAEAFLRRSVAAEHPLAIAQNDLAEVLHRLKRYEEAEVYARAAVKTEPNLYVAWETLGSTLLDQNKNLDEAESCVNKAISIIKSEKNQIEDIRMYITLARVQIARGDDRSRSQARVTLRKIRDRKSELSAYDLAMFENLQKAVQVKR